MSTEALDDESPGPWWTYVLRCSDDTLYVGVTTDLHRRVHEHGHTARGARYTRVRRPVRLVAAWPHPDRSAAQKAESAFRKLRRTRKLRLLAAAPLQELPDAAPPKGTVPDEVGETA